jgi:hypothetical protein
MLRDGYLMKTGYYCGAIGVCAAVWLVSVMTGLADSATPDERGLWRVWVAATNNPADHAAVIDACRSFSARSPQDPLVVVAKGMEAWHQLKCGGTNEAVRLLEPLLAVPGNATPLQVAGATIARSWLTRIDREQVLAALRKLYLRDIEFPQSLDAVKTLKAAPLPPLADRWGMPWVYRRQSPIKGMKPQQYLVESSRLGSRSALGGALALPYAGNITLEPVSPSTINSDTYEFAAPQQKAIFLQTGAERDGVTVAYLGVNLIVLSDENHWRVVLKPK